MPGGCRAVTTRSYYRAESAGSAGSPRLAGMPGVGCRRLPGLRNLPERARGCRISAPGRCRSVQIPAGAGDAWIVGVSVGVQLLVVAHGRVGTKGLAAQAV